MKKSVCPYCDQVMKYPGYCSFCRRPVLHPETREINYYLNERHPAVEENCSYHGSLPGENREKIHSGEDRHISSSVPAKQRKTGTPETPAVIKDRKGRVLPQQIRPSRPAAEAAGRARGTKKKKFNVIFAALLVYMTVMVAGSVIKSFDGFDKKAETAFLTSPVIQQAEETLHDWQRTDEQVKEEGIPCNAYGHLDADEDTAVTAFQESMKQAGYSSRLFYSGSINIVQDDYSSYNTYRNFDLMDGDVQIGQMELCFDTATGQMHGIQVTADQDQIWNVNEAAFRAMKDMGLLEEETGSKALLEELMADVSEKNMSLTEQDGLEIGLAVIKSGGDTTYCLMIYGKGYLTRK